MNGSSQNLPTFGAADLTNCDREPIHIPASVQPHGVLLALDRESLRIVQAGGDTTGVFQSAPEGLLGRELESVLPGDRVARVKSLLDAHSPIGRPLHAFTHAAAHGSMVDAVLHESSGLALLEFEPLVDESPEDALEIVQTMLLRVQQEKSPRSFCQSMTDEVRRVTGFDRVMVYRFLPDGAGVVDAESRDSVLEPFLGLHYPASDIPRQARELYLKNWTRLIPNARYTPAPILPPVNPRDGTPLDLSYSAIRSVSPIHLEYLANMGVAASMSLSLIVGGRLWGLVACHHQTPRYLPHRLRMAGELFAQMASSQLESRVAAEDYEAQLKSMRVHEELVMRMSREGDLAEGLMRYRPNLLDYVPAGGVGIWFGGSYTELGPTPGAENVCALVAWLNGNVAEGVFHTDRLPLAYPPAENFAGVGSGLLALSVSKVPRDYVLWFRPETIRTVDWAGDPEKAVQEDSGRIAPRKSFSAWSEAVRFRSHPWKDVEVEAARMLRVSLMEVILKRIDQIAREREEARAKQAQLASELDRRLEDLRRETERRAVAETELSEVLRSTVEEQEAERLRIARELHDSLGQTVTLLQLGLDELGASLQSGQNSDARLAKLKALARSVGSEANRLAWEIRPTALDDLGLQTAIQHLAETWSERTGVQFDLRLALGDRRLAPPLETALYRVLQEALTNIARHAGASRVGVLLEARGDEARMIVEDDGCGFSPEVSTRRLGLLGMRERLALVSGTLEIESAPGRGCTLYARVPL